MNRKLRHWWVILAVSGLFLAVVLVDVGAERENSRLEYDDVQHGYYSFISGIYLNWEDHSFDADGICTVCGYAKNSGAVLPGDLNKDGDVDSLDGLLLMRYLNGWDVTVECPDAMDVNADGKVDSLDGLLLMRYLNGWDVKLKTSNADTDTDGDVIADGWI